MEIIVTMLTVLGYYRYPAESCGYFIFNIPINFQINMEMVIVNIPITVFIVLSIMKNLSMLLF